MIYTVKDIQEDLDYGCEERREGTPLMAVVTLEDENGGELIRKVPDKGLCDEGIGIGGKVYFDEDNVLRKALSREHWTKDLSGMDIDVNGFIDDMEGLIRGTKKRWVCPFCGGDILLVSSKEGKHKICCSRCDMTIEIDALLINKSGG